MADINLLRKEYELVYTPAHQVVVPIRVLVPKTSNPIPDRFRSYSTVYYGEIEIVSTPGNSSTGTYISYKVTTYNGKTGQQINIQTSMLISPMYGGFGFRTGWFV